jgi:4a-hydroxytetrahydrobiopterin dehydratase
MSEPLARPLARPIALSESQITEALTQLKGWSLKSEKLFKKFEFEDFSSAMSFMVHAISKIEKLNHHPEWFNVYNRVEVALITHDVANGSAPAITKLDVELALHLDKIFKN